MKPILYIKGSDSNDVRLNKFLIYFKQINVPVKFIGWNRYKTLQNVEDSSVYIYNGGGYGRPLLVFHYQIWMIKVFFYFLLKRNLKSYNIIAINFDSAFPLYLASIIRGYDFIYEVYDQFAISYKFPSCMKNILNWIDSRVMNKARFIIHVDQNRVKTHHHKSIIIENTPYDFFKGNKRTYDYTKHKFAVTGLLNENRGLNHIINFAKEHTNIEFLFVGSLIDVNDEQVKLIHALPNIEIHEFMPQNKLFEFMIDCCGIFSLYNPIIEINLLAASNKVYDAMMLGIPVITNSEVINSKFIKENNIGVIVNYEYDDSWEQLASNDFIETAISKGKNGRNIYINNYIFEDIVSKVMINILK